MRRGGIILSSLLFSGCAPIAALVNPAYIPQPIHVYDQATYDADVAECLTAGANYKPSLSVGSVASSTFSGATSNLSLVPFSPAVPAYGALGGAAGSVSGGLDIMSRSHRNVAKNCLERMTGWDHSAIVANPD